MAMAGFYFFSLCFSGRQILPPLEGDCGSGNPENLLARRGVDSWEPAVRILVAALAKRTRTGVKKKKKKEEEENKRINQSDERKRKGKGKKKPLCQLGNTARWQFDRKRRSGGLLNY